MRSLTVAPARTISGALPVPGDKSISHRYALLAALADGASEIQNFSPADDCRRTLHCLSRLGVSVGMVTLTPRDQSAPAPPTVTITGRGLDSLRRPAGFFSRPLDCGNSGTTIRLLAGLLAGQSFDTTLTGDASLRRRPMRRVIEPLAQMGARIRARSGDLAPLKIRGSRLHSINYTLPLPSAQVKSAILLAGLFADGVTSVTEPVRTRDHTELALAEFGARLDRTADTIRLHGRTGNSSPRLEPRRLVVPGDLSSAVFFLAAALILPDSNLLLGSVGLNPTRAAVLDFLASMGATISLVSVRSAHGELVGDIAVRHSQLQGGVVSGPQVAQMIDELPMLAALGPYTEKGIEIRDAQELRVKESDRIAALAQNLRRMGARVEEFSDGLRVAGRSAAAVSASAAPLHGAEIDPAGDHRIAMAFAVAALGASSPSVIRDSACVAVSSPDFFSSLDRLLDR